ncbi:MAG TPA: hypothetical protein VE821_13320 [Pyrinomonadaceae bacterium]|nr:hypothetical protein [Pyrinomonadaceae bacterium]
MSEKTRQKKAGQRTDKKNKQMRDATSARRVGGKSMELPKDKSNLGDKPEPRGK